MLRSLAFTLIALLAGCQAQAQDWGSGAEVARPPSDDWAFEPSKKAFGTFDSKHGDFSCAKLGEYVTANDPWAAFYAIRDAALFGDKTCAKSIAVVDEALSKKPITSTAVAFYEAKMGEEAGLTALLKTFDDEAIPSESGPALDHIAVSLFGFFPDWDQTGRRLLRHAKYADGAASAMNGNALVWKKHLYGGEPSYAADCAESAELEDVASMASYLCNPPMPSR